MNTKYLFLLFLQYICCVSAISASWSSEEVDDLLEYYANSFNVPGVSVALVSGDNIITKGYGFIDLNNNIAVTPDTILPISSCTKPITCLLIGSLTDEGYLCWDDKIVEHIPNFSLQDYFTTHNITVSDYLTHQSGYPSQDWLWYAEEMTKKDLVQMLKCMTPQTLLRQKFIYQNIGYAVVSYIAEIVTDKSWNQLFQEYICEPLGLENTFSILSLSNQKSIGHVSNGNKLTQIYSNPIDVISAAGGVVSSANDMAKIIMCMVNNGKNIVTNNTWKEITTPRVFSNFLLKDIKTIPDVIAQEQYTLGWFLVSYRGNKVYLHPGNTEGFSSFMFLIPSINSGGIVMTNKHSTPFPWILSAHLIDLSMGLEPIKWVDTATNFTRFFNNNNPKDIDVNSYPSLHPYHHFVGEYHHDGYGKLKITEQEGNIYLLKNNLKLNLVHRSHNIFKIESTQHAYLNDVNVIFRYNFAGDVHKVSLTIENDNKEVDFVKNNNASFSTTNVKYSHLDKYVGNYTYNGISFSIEREENKLKINCMFIGQTHHLLYVSDCMFSVKNNNEWHVKFHTNSKQEVEKVELFNNESGASYFANKSE